MQPQRNGCTLQRLKSPRRLHRVPVKPEGGIKQTTNDNTATDGRPRIKPNDPLLDRLAKIAERQARLAMRRERKAAQRSVAEQPMDAIRTGRD